MKKKTVSSVPYTKEMEIAIDRYRVRNLMTRDDFFKKAKLSGRPILAYWEKTGRISFNAVRNLKHIGIDLLPYIKNNNG